MNEPDEKLIEEVLTKLNISAEIFNNIKNLQKLPDDVVINFLLSESSLSKTDFVNRFSDEKKF